MTPAPRERSGGADQAAGTADQAAGADGAAVTRARREGLGLSLVGVYGLSFGAVAVASGLSPLQAIVLSVVGFSGGSQFAVAGVAAAGGAPVTAVASAWLLGIRNSLYAVRVAPLLPRSPWRRALAAQLVIDETTAMTLRHEPSGEAAARTAFWTTGLGLFVTWNATTTLGAVGVSTLGDPSALGLDAAAPAAFLALLWPYLRQRRTALVAGVAAAVALGTSFLLPAGVPVLAGGIVALVGLASPGRDQAAASGTTAGETVASETTTSETVAGSGGSRGRAPGPRPGSGRLS